MSRTTNVGSLPRKIPRLGTNLGSLRVMMGSLDFFMGSLRMNRCRKCNKNSHCNYLVMSVRCK